MKVDEIKALYEKMKREAEGDVLLKCLATDAAEALQTFYSLLDAVSYCDDPMSEQAPSECLTAHMQEWDKLNRYLDKEATTAKREEAEMHRPPTAEEMRDTPY